MKNYSNTLLISALVLFSARESTASDAAGKSASPKALAATTAVAACAQLNGLLSTTDSVAALAANLSPDLNSPKGNIAEASGLLGTGNSLAALAIDVAGKGGPVVLSSATAALPSKPASQPSAVAITAKRESDDQKSFTEAFLAWDPE